MSYGVDFKSYWRIFSGRSLHVVSIWFCYVYFLGKAPDRSIRMGCMRRHSFYAAGHAGSVARTCVLQPGSFEVVRAPRQLRGRPVCSWLQGVLGLARQVARSVDETFDALFLDGAMHRWRRAVRAFVFWLMFIFTIPCLLYICCFVFLAKVIISHGVNSWIHNNM